MLYQEAQGKTTKVAVARFWRASCSSSQSKFHPYVRELFCSEKNCWKQGYKKTNFSSIKRKGGLFKFDQI